MVRYGVGVICQWVVAPLLAVAGLVPGAIWVYRACHWLEQDQTYVNSSGAYLLQAAIVALGALAGAYILFRLGSYLKSKRRSGA
jgi:hypothetical protein